jgi:hypothetical protein
VNGIPSIEPSMVSWSSVSMKKMFGGAATVAERQSINMR